MTNGVVGLLVLFVLGSLGQSEAKQDRCLAGRIEMNSGAPNDGVLPGVIAPVGHLSARADTSALKTCIEKHRFYEKEKVETKLDKKISRADGDLSFEDGPDDTPTPAAKTEFFDRPVGINLDCACNNGPKLLAAGNYEAAAAAFKQYGQQVLLAFESEECPDYATALTWEGYANYKLGRDDEARKLWLKAVKIYAENETRQDIIQWIYNRLGAIAKARIE